MCYTSLKVLYKLLPPPLLFVLLYSFLPHKELRFIIYVIPLLNAAAAVGFVRSWRWATATAPAGKKGSGSSAPTKKDDGDGAPAAAPPSTSSMLGAVVKLGLVGIVVATLATTAAFTSFSVINYPGGDAFARFHLEAAAASGTREGGVTVHIAVPPAQTGVSRFGESSSDGLFTYSKVEAWTDAVTPSSFEWLLTGDDG